MASPETNFEDRLRLYWPELKQRYMELYHDDAMLKKLRCHLAAFSEARRESLKQRDAEKQNTPNWYQSRELLGMMLYIDNFAGNLKGVKDKLCGHGIPEPTMYWDWDAIVTAKNCWAYSTSAKKPHKSSCRRERQRIC